MFCLKISSSSCLNFSWITWVDFGSNCEKKYKSISHPAELRKIYEAILNDVVGQVDYLLFHGVEAQHLHGRVEVLRVDGGLPKAGLVAPEDRRDDVQLLLGQLVTDLEHLSGDTSDIALGQYTQDKQSCETKQNSYVTKSDTK